MNLEYIFPTPIWSHMVECNLSNMIDTIQHFKKDSEGRIVSNKGGWQSEDFVVEDLPSCFNPVLQSIDALSKCALDEYGSNLSPYIDNLWFNINTRGDSNRTHLHAESFLSGVFYFQATEQSGDIVFSRQPMEDYAIITHLRSPRMTRLAASCWSYKPRASYGLMFPSWLMHKVESSNCDTERISMAYNIKVQ